MSIPLKRKVLLWRDAAMRAAEVRKRAAQARTGQVVRSTIDVGDNTVSMDDALVGGVEAGELSAEQQETIDLLDQDQADSVGFFLDGTGLDIEDQIDAAELGYESIESDADRWEEAADAEEAAHVAHMNSIANNLTVDAAQMVAEQAADDALQAKQTADGRNRIYAQPLNPVAPPEIPFVNGDLWYRTEVVGGKTRFVEVFMWNGAVWAAYQMVASSLLVPGSVGPVLIENGAITGQKLAFDAIDGKTITGALIRTAPTGQRLELGAYGLVAYDDTNYPVASISSAGGNMMMTGSLWTRDPANTTGLVGGCVLSPTGVMAKDYKTSNEVSMDSLSGFEHYLPQTAVNPPKHGTVEADRINLATYQRNGTAAGPHTGQAYIGTSDGGEIDLRARRGSVERRFYVTPGQTSGYTIFTDGAEPLVELRRDHVHFTKPVTYDTDTNWAAVTVPGGTGTCQWRRVGGIVYLQFDFTYTTAIPAGGGKAPVFTLPAAARPPANWPITVMGAGTWPAVGYVEGATGNSAIRNDSASSVARYMGSGQWPQ